ncbi:sugar ABC transporter substrate-binding protein [Pseudooceanicola sp. CBS1P-1]|uniref:Substrate-binding domain-containing protein n=1 Tax=Pseudooceanicola albus TaxID=2692189 RepID=A0A6L7G5P5_9RHOB|nr:MULTISPECIES: sugar ABC transporter substrate-binding protein [Pseudooceanicola]MBT9386816.1 sugar ABC transporter substrate-binding protein [Pseudooceanicola endophyticus]MXN19361.1 substrate-binding domain-containing protein [Pseudooceanicola albus]
MNKFSRLAATLSTAAVAACFATAGFAADIFVIGGKPDDPFWSIVKRGAEDAGIVAEKQGGSVTWLGPQNYDNLGVDAAELIRQAISQGADAIVAPDWVPEAMDPAFEAVKKAGIPFIVINAGGIEAADKLGALNYVGSDDYEAGKAAGKYFAGKDIKNVICVNTLPGAANIEANCKGLTEGIKEAGGTGEVLPLPATSFGNQTAVAQAVKAYLLQHPDVGGIYTVSDVDANASINGVMQSGKSGKVQVGGLNMDETILGNIQSGKQLFAIDQQGYMQGYLAASILNAHVNFGLTVPTREILTGPGIIDASNVEVTMEGMKKGAR